MAQTFYIEADEEIISVVGRLRHTRDAEIVLVVPKHAILMQSIVSLKLLEREAKKIGKVIMIVSQDENGRTLAEKAGLLTRSYQEEQSRGEGEENTDMRPVFNAPEPTVEFSEPKLTHALKAENIGSESFFALEHGARSSINPPIATEEREPLIQQSAPLRISIRDKSPKLQTALNSKQIIATPTPSQSARQPLGMPSFGPPSQIIPKQQSPVTTPTSNSFFSTQAALPKATKSAPSAPVQLPATIHGRMKFIIAGIGIIVLLLIGGVSFFLFTPKAIITVLPTYSKEQSAFELKLISAGIDTALTEADSSTLEVPYRLIEDTVAVPITITPSGVGASGERKARGKVVIYNAFSADPQPLVATTRLETGSGIIFRLTAGVTVPGVTTIAGKEEPGAIEAEIVADQSGDAFNIAPTTFTIPGFKGNAKYEKFSAKLLTPTTGGSKDGASGDPLLTISDIEQTKKLARDTALESFRQSIEGTLQDGEKIEDNGIELTATQEEPLLHEGLTGASLQTTFHYQVKAYIVSTTVVERALLRILSTSEKRTTSAGLPLLPKTIVIDTLELIPDFKLGGGKLKATASIILSTDIQTEALQNELLGKQADELRPILDKHPEIAKMNLDLQPKFFIKYIPKNKDAVTVIVAEPEQ
ncbi:MAG: hypothetical protein WAU28_03190 [Candidatus Moraniibacteriota bacterium]